MLSHKDNTPVHKSTVAMAAIQECGFELIHHPFCSPGLAPSDYYLFIKMKKGLSGCNFDSDDDVITAIDHILKVRDAKFYKEGTG